MARFNIRNSHILPTQCIYVLRMAMKQTAITASHNNDCFFITNRQCVQCAVRAEYLSMIYFSHSLQTVKIQAFPDKIRSYKWDD
jgi:hypothetical protein